MIFGKKIVVVLPAYNAEATVRQTYRGLPMDAIDEVLLVDDGSLENTAKIAIELELRVFKHHKNHGYGRNQKTCYRTA